MTAYDTLLGEMFPDSKDAFRCHRTLVKLARHVNGQMALTGGLAYSWHLQQYGREVERRPLNDIDLVVADLAALAPALGEESLISHFHPSRGRGKILLQLVDADQRMRIDLFTPFSSSLMSRAHHTELCGISCGVIAAEDLTARLLAIACDVTTGKSVDPKYYDKFRRLSELIDLKVARDIWSDYRKPDCPHHFDEAAEAVRQAVAQNPGVLRPELYAQPADAACPWCGHSDLFSVSPPAEIFAVLGYV